MSAIARCVRINAGWTRWPISGISGHIRAADFILFMQLCNRLQFWHQPKSQFYMSAVHGSTFPASDKTLWLTAMEKNPVMREHMFELSASTAWAEVRSKTKKSDGVWLIMTIWCWQNGNIVFCKHTPSSNMLSPVKTLIKVTYLIAQRHLRRVKSTQNDWWSWEQLGH